jgi:hypothetical protein
MFIFTFFFLLLQVAGGIVAFLVIVSLLVSCAINRRHVAATAGYASQVDEERHL